MRLLRVREAKTWLWGSERSYAYPLAFILNPPLRKLGVTPNMITLTNLLTLVPLAAYTWSHAWHWTTLFVTLFCQLLDAMDGSMARKYGLGSKLGAILDEATDLVHGVTLVLSGVYGSWNYPMGVVFLCVYGYVSLVGELCYANSKERKSPPKYVEELSFFEYIGAWGVENGSWNKAFGLTAIVACFEFAESSFTELLASIGLQPSMPLLGAVMFILPVSTILLAKSSKVEDEPQPEEAKADSGKELNVRVLTLNTFLIVPFLFSNTQKEQRMEALLAEHADKYDVLCLQEVFDTFSGRACRLVRLARKKYGFTYYHQCEAPSLLRGKTMDGGVIVLSRFPIVEAGWQEYTRPSCHSDRLAAKGALHVKLEVGGHRYLHVVSTHCQAAYGRHDKAAIAVQRLQAQQLAEFVQKSTQGDEEPVLICGHININSRPVVNDLGFETASKTKGKAGEGEENTLEYQKMMGTFKKILGGGASKATVTDIVSKWYEGSPPPTMQLFIDDGKVVHPFPVSEEEVKAKQMKQRGFTLDHMILWERDAKKDTEVADLRIEALHAGKASAKEIKPLSQGLSDHRGISCTFRLRPDAAKVKELGPYKLPQPPREGYFYYRSPMSVAMPCDIWVILITLLLSVYAADWLTMVQVDQVFVGAIAATYISAWFV